MVTALALKKRADFVLEEVFRSLFEEIDTEKVRKDIAAVKERASDDFAPIDHARMLSRRAAIRCAAAGAVTGLPTGLLAIGTLGADLAFLVFQQFRLILGIAAIYGHEPTHRERFNEALQCLAFASGVWIGKSGVSALVESATIEGGVIAEKIGMRFVKERLTKLIPLVGALSGAALNYIAVRAVGNAAVRYYDSRVETVLAEEIWAEGDRDHA
jgi:hypothetical protein